MGPARQAQGAARERRKCRRYPVKLRIRYRLPQDPTAWEEGLGATHDLSAEGLSFRADRNLPIGAEVDLRIDWPMRINGAPCLCAVITGRIIRCNGTEIAVAILRSDFQTER